MARPSMANNIMRPEKIKMAIKSTQSMGQAALYMGVSKQTFKKYAKQYGLWSPAKSSKGIRRSNTGNFKHDLKAILEGKSPNPYRENTLLAKGIREGYISPCCDNCSQAFHFVKDKEPPLILDFLDRNTQNTDLENLRVLCFNCVYILAHKNRGWYRHRDTAIGQALDSANTELVKEKREIPKDDELTYIPFEEFQKML